METGISIGAKRDEKVYLKVLGVRFAMVTRRWQLLGSIPLIRKFTNF